jgi:hypothetical protein
MNAMDNREHVRALMSLYVTGLQLTHIASCGPHQLRAVLLPHVGEIERVMEDIRALMQPAGVAEPASPRTI